MRREGLYGSLLSERRRQRDRGGPVALTQPAGRRPADPRDHTIAKVEAHGRRGDLGWRATVIRATGTAFEDRAAPSGPASTRCAVRSPQGSGSGEGPHRRDGCGRGRDPS